MYRCLISTGIVCVVGVVQVGMNNHVWYHDATEGSKALVNEREYVSTVDAVKLSSRYAVVLSDGRISIHAIEAGGPADRGTMVSAAADR